MKRAKKPEKSKTVFKNFKTISFNKWVLKHASHGIGLGFNFLHCKKCNEVYVVGEVKYIAEALY